jgi:hypothetical protein
MIWEYIGLLTYITLQRSMWNERGFTQFLRTIGHRVGYVKIHSQCSLAYAWNASVLNEFRSNSIFQMLSKCPPNSVFIHIGHILCGMHDRSEYVQWRVEPLLRNDHEINKYTRTVSGNSSVNTFPRQLIRMQQSKYCWKRGVSAWSVLRCYKQGTKSVDSSVWDGGQPGMAWVRKLKTLHWWKRLPGND